MYRFSRSIYREIAPAVIEDGRDECFNRQRVLDACEATMRRLACDRHYFARPARSLFGEIRSFFAIGDQLRVYRVVDRNVKLAIEYLEKLPPEARALDGAPAHCRAFTRKGSACQRQPLPGRLYCPSHKHLEVELGAAAPAKAERQVVGAV